MDRRTKKYIILSGIGFLMVCIAVITMAIFFATHRSEATKTVIIDNYSQYTKHISPKSFSSLGSYLYSFITKPDKEIYHAMISEGTYSYSPDSWFSEFIVKLNDSDITWKVKLQTVSSGDINGDISIICNSGKCSSLEQTNIKPILQAYLPLSTSDYIIATKTNDLKSISVVYYDQQGTGKEKALEKIRSLGFNPDDYTIEYHYGGR